MAMSGSDAAAEYEEAYREWTEACADNLEIQSLVAAHLREHGTQEETSEKGLPADTSDRKMEKARAEYEEQLGKLVRVKIERQNVQEEAARLNEAVQAQAKEKEKNAQMAWNDLEILQKKTAESSRNRNKQTLDPKIVDDLLRKIRHKVDEWRKLNCETAEMTFRKLRYEEKVHKQMVAAGGDNATLPFAEFRANLQNSQSRLTEKQRQIRDLTEKEKNSINELTHMAEKLDHLKNLGQQLQEKVERIEKQMLESKQRARIAHAMRTGARSENRKLVEKAELLTKPFLIEDLAKKIVERNRLIRYITHAKEEFKLKTATHTENGKRMLDRDLLECIPDSFHEYSVVENIAAMNENDRKYGQRDKF